jgi:SAM-dependent methyltransferase
MFPDARFDFVYSYAVFQHIPSREVVFHYLDEAWRVLKPGGILACQINGLPANARQYDTWSGVRIAPSEIHEMARARGWQLLGLEQIWTQYMWVTCRKPGDAVPGGSGESCSIRNVSNAFSGESVAPAAGPQAALSVWIQNLAPDADLNNLRIAADARDCRPIYIGEPAADGVSQVTAWLPEGLRTGLVPVEVMVHAARVAAPAWVRIMPSPPAVPRIAALTDAINLMSGNRIVTRRVKVSLSDVKDAAGFDAAVDSQAALEIDSFCTDPVEGRWEFNFLLPNEIGAGPHQVELRLGRRQFPPTPIEVA